MFFLKYPLLNATQAWLSFMFHLLLIISIDKYIIDNFNSNQLDPNNIFIQDYFYPEINAFNGNKIFELNDDFYEKRKIYCNKNIEITYMLFN